jgi:hypothetical protein
MAFAGGGKQKTDKGLPLISTSPYSYSDTDRSRFQGALYTAPANVTTSFNFPIPEEIRLYGGHYWVQGATAGDKMSFQVVDIDNILGFGPETVVHEYITDMPVPPWDHEKDLESPTAALIPGGLYLRVVYVNATSDPVTLGVTYKWFLQQ